MILGVYKLGEEECNIIPVAVHKQKAFLCDASLSLHSPLSSM